MQALLNEHGARYQLGNIGRTKLYELIAAGELQTVKIGRRRFVVAASVDEYVDRLAREQRADTPAPAA
jgi:excisionase family DNA binding protein